MDKDQRKGSIPIPDNLDELLTKEQRQALPGLKYLGWEPCFLRKRMFLEPEMVMQNNNDKRLGVFEHDGNIRLQGDIKVRDGDKVDQATQHEDPQVWTK
mgnify:FL=1|jgi:hypothetical protein